MELSVADMEPQTQTAQHRPNGTFRSSFQGSLPGGRIHKTVISITPKSAQIKVIPYVNVRQLVGLSLLVIWPVLLGILFGVYGTEEAYQHLDVRLNVAAYEKRVNDVEHVVESLTTEQKSILAALPYNTSDLGNLTAVANDFVSLAVTYLIQLDTDYKDLKQQHIRGPPLTLAATLRQWGNSLSDQENSNPIEVANNISTVIRGIRMFFSAHHSTNMSSADIWDYFLQKLYLNEVVYRLKDLKTFGTFAIAYNKTVNGTIDEKLRLTLLRRFTRSMFALELFDKYGQPKFRVGVLKNYFPDYGWTKTRKFDLWDWRLYQTEIIYMDNPAILHKLEEKLEIAFTDSSTAFHQLMEDALYPINLALRECKTYVDDRFQKDYDAGIAIFTFVLAVVLFWLLTATNLLAHVGSSLTSIFSESYRFQWVQLCRRRAIEREQSRSDKIVSEMFFEVNFKYLYEGTLPPMVIYKDASIAFIELLQYEELCKIYSTVDHVALLDWYYHLVSSAIKGFNTSVVATAGHYCLLAGTHVYHAENVALTVLRLLTLTRESFLPPPHQTRLPLIKAGIHTGSVAGAILSLKFPIFTMLGDTVNTASRMNSKSKPYCVLISEATNAIVSKNFRTKSAGVFNVKGKGDMNTFWLLSCNWAAFATNFVDLELSEKLRELHDLDEFHITHTRHRTGVSRETQHTICHTSSGARRDSTATGRRDSVGSGKRNSSTGGSAETGELAGLGGGLLQSLLNSKKKKKKKAAAQNAARGLTPTDNEDAANTQRDHSAHSADSITKPPVEVIEMKGRGSRRIYPAQLSTKVDIKASPNESYYVQVANNVFMRSWKHI